MTATRFLLDTNVVIGVLAGDVSALELIQAHEATLETCAVSQITRIELLSFQSLTDSEETRVLAFLAAVRVFVLDEAVEQEAISLRRRTRMKLPDAIVAATAKVHGLTLLTLDREMRSKTE